MKTQPIMEIEVNGLRSITEDEILYLLDLKKGIPLDAKQLRIGIKRAFLKGISGISSLRVWMHNVIGYE